MRDYVDHIKSTVAFALDGMKVGIDCANGSASRTAEKLFTELGATCFMLSDNLNGINVNDNCGSTHMESLMTFVKENHLDAGVAFDGDADRCLAVDEKGQLVDGDFLMAICAADLKSRGKLAKSAAVGTIMTNMDLTVFVMKTVLNSPQPRLATVMYWKRCFRKAITSAGTKWAYYFPRLCDYR